MPSYSVTVAAASAVPVKVGMVTLVMLSVLDAPLSEPRPGPGADGAAGGVVSNVTAWVASGAEIASEIDDLRLDGPVRGMAGAVRHAPGRAAHRGGAQVAPPSKLTCRVSPVPSAAGQRARDGASSAAVVGDEIAGDATVVGHRHDGDGLGRRGLIEHVGLEGARWRRPSAFSTRAISVLLPVSVTPRARRLCSRGRGRGQPCRAVVERHLHHVTRRERGAQRARDGLGGDVGDEVGGARSGVGRERDGADHLSRRRRDACGA